MFQDSLQTNECTYQSTLAMRKTTSVISSRFKRFKAYLQKKDSYDLVGESDAHWSGDVNERKSTPGFYFKLNWRSTQLGCQEADQIALSSSEAEYQGMAAAVQEAFDLKQLLEDFGVQQKHPIAIGEDNQSCIKLCQNTDLHKRSKNIETKVHFNRDKIDGLFQFVTSLLTKWQPISSRNLYPYRRWKHSEMF